MTTGRRPFVYIIHISICVFCVVFDVNMWIVCNFEILLFMVCVNGLNLTETFYLLKSWMVNASKQWCTSNTCNTWSNIRWTEQQTIKKLTRKLPLDRRSVVDVVWLVDCSPPGPVIGTTEPPVLIPWPSVALYRMCAMQTRREEKKRKEKNAYLQI